MAKINYRIVTLIAALSSVILSAIALAFLVTSVIRYRADDFFTASATKDFTTLGTCVETLTHDQLKELDYNNQDLDCKNDYDRGNKLKMLNTLRVSVHSLYYAYHVATYVDKAGATVRVRERHAIGDHIETVMAALVAHVLYYQGVVSGYVANTNPGTVAGSDQFYTSNTATGGVTTPGTRSTFVNVGLNFTSVYQALNLVTEVDVPVSCDVIYDLTYADISNDDETYGTSEATTKTSGTTVTRGVLVDTPYELFIKNIRSGRLDDDLNTKDTWPLGEFSADCPKEVQTVGVDYLPAGQADRSDALTADMKKWMYAHCIAQFEFASVGTSAWEGTYGIPLPGIEPGPSMDWYPKAEGFNDTSSYNTRTRMYLGQRFGMSIWAYVPMFLATCFLLGDSLVFFFTEALMPIILKEQVNFAANQLSNVRDSLVIASTTRSSRRKRLAIGFVAVLVSIVFYSIFILGPWGFFYTSMPRPICEKSGKDPNFVGGDPDHGVPQIFWKGTKGGWRTDYDATWYDLMAIFLQLFVLFLLPLTTTDLCRNLNNSIKESTSGRTTDTGVQQAAQRVQNSAAYKFTQKVLVLPLIVGIVIIITGQSISGARFGMAWAEGVVAQEWNEDQTGWLFDEVAISEHVYDQTIATLAATVSCGLIFAVAMQRHLINGVGCFSAGLFFGWCALVLVFGLPLVFYAMSRSIFTENKANEDCAVFPRTSHEYDNDLCTSRFWTFLVGGGLFVGTVLVMTVLGLIEALPSIFANRKTASVPLPSTQEESALMRATGPASQVNAGFRSANDPFFNPTLKPQTRSVSSSNEFLYAGKLKVPAPRR